MRSVADCRAQSDGIIVQLYEHMVDTNLMRRIVACGLWICCGTLCPAGEVLKNGDFSRAVSVVKDESQSIESFGKPGRWHFVDGGSKKGAWKLIDGVALRRQEEGEDSAGAFFQYVQDGGATQGRRLLRFDLKWDAEGGEYRDDVDLAIVVFAWNGRPPKIDSQNHDVDHDGGNDTLNAHPRTVNLFTGVANDETPLSLIENNVAKVDGLRRAAGFQTIDVAVDFADGFDFVGVLFNGEARHGAQLAIDNVRFEAHPDPDPDFPDQHQGVSFWTLGDRAEIDSAALSPAGPFVEMTNGDVLPARATAWQPPPSGRDTGHLLVELRGGLGRTMSKRLTDFRVRADCVRRIVWDSSGEPNSQPGAIRIRDGRRMTASRVAFTDDGLRCLTREGVVTIAFAALRDVHLPQTSAAAAALRDAAWMHIQPDCRLVRLRTRRGAHLTFPEPFVRAIPLRKRDAGSPRVYAVRPHWSLDTLTFAPDEMLLATVLPANEIPLSVLSCSAEEQPTRWRWQRNRSVKGSLLRVGNCVAASGFGTHAPSRLVVELPPGAQTFRCRVGIDRLVRHVGGCVRCQVADPGSKQPLWTSPLIRSDDDPLRVGPLDVSGTTRLELITEAAHEDRPRGAAPSDVGDHVDWLVPTITVDLKHVPRPPEDLTGWLPQLTWNMPAALADRMRLRAVWHSPGERRRFALVPGPGRNRSP